MYTLFSIVLFRASSCFVVFQESNYFPFFDQSAKVYNDIKAIFSTVLFVNSLLKDF